MDNDTTLAVDPRLPSKCFFVILFGGRTDSSYLVSCLNSHPNVLCYGEMLNSSKLERQKSFCMALVEGKPLEDFSKFALPARYCHEHTMTDRLLHAVGLKTKLADIADKNLFQQFLQNHHFRVIYLTRRNPVKQALSGFNARRLHKVARIYNAVEDSQVQGAIYVEPDELLAKAKKQVIGEQRIEGFINSLGLRTLKLQYEDMLHMPARFFERVLGFLEVENVPVNGKTLKNTPDRLSDAIVNFDEVAARLKGTEFEDFLEE